jgi:ABC-2 type transport system permease protein
VRLAGVGWHVLRHECRLVGRLRATWILAGLLAAVVAGAAWNGSRWTNEQRGVIAAVQAEDDRLYRNVYTQLDELERQGDPNPGLELAGMAWYLYQPEGAVAPAPHIDPRRAEAAGSEWVGARHAVLSPAPLGALAIGQSDLFPFYTRVTIRTRPALIQSEEIEHPDNLLSGRFDLAFVLTFCWPLLVLPLLYNVVSEERESGTLALIACQPVSLRSVLAARLMVRGGLMIALTLVVSLGSLVLSGAVQGGTFVPLAIWIAAVVATGIFWCGIAAVINLTRWRSAANATAFTACWLATVVVVPAMLSEVASTISPVPSRVALVSAVRDAGTLTGTEIASLVTSYYEEHPDAQPTGQSADVTAIRGLAQQDAVDRRVDPILAAYRNAAAHQQSLVDLLRFVSPPLLIYDAVTELAGTTTTRYRQFGAQVDAYHRAWRDYFYPLARARTTMTRTHYEQAPRFTFREEEPERVERRALVLILSAAGVGTLLLTMVYWRLNAVRQID